MSKAEIFVRIYRAANATEAHIIRGMLEQHDIRVRLRGEGLSSGLGELPAEVVEVEVQVPTGYRQLARQLVEEYETRSPAAGNTANDWRCKGCGELNPVTFAVCWNCQRQTGAGS